MLKYLYLLPQSNADFYWEQIRENSFKLFSQVSHQQQVLWERGPKFDDLTRSSFINHIVNFNKHVLSKYNMYKTVLNQLNPSKSWVKMIKDHAPFTILIHLCVSWDACMISQLGLRRYTQQANVFSGVVIVFACRRYTSLTIILPSQRVVQHY